MVSRRELNRTGRKLLVKPFVVLAAKCLGPGRLRLEMVKLAHDLVTQTTATSPTKAAGARPGFPPDRRAGFLPITFLRARVLPLWEAFLLQMNYFDRFLEFELQRMLDPVAASAAPRRARWVSSGAPLPAAVTGPVELVAEALPVVESVAIPAQPVHLV